MSVFNGFTSEEHPIDSSFSEGDVIHDQNGVNEDAHIVHDNTTGNIVGVIPSVLNRFNSQLNSFGWALEMLKAGHKLARKGWNGKGIHIRLIKGFDLEKEAEKSHIAYMAAKMAQGITSRLSESGEEFMVPYSELSEEAKDLSRECVKRPDAITQDFIAIDSTGLKTDNKFSPKKLVPWLASQTDMLCDDWEIYIERR